MFKTTLASLRARKLRLFTTGFAVLLGVAFMAGSLVLTDTIGRTFDNLFADVNKGTDAFVRGKSAIKDEQGTESRTRVDDAILRTVQSVAGVKAAHGSVSGFAQLVDKKGEAIGNPGQGAPVLGGNWTADANLNPFVLVSGRAPAAADEVVIDRGSAKKAGFVVGDKTTVLVKTGAEPITIVGIARFGDADSPGGASFVGFTDATAQRVLTAPGEYNGVTVVAESGVSQTELQSRLAKALPDTVEVVTGAQLTKENQDDIKKGLAFFGTFLTSFAYIALFVGAFIIYNTFSILVAQRGRENALLRAIGASRRQVLGSVLFEALVVGVIASAFGIVGGLGMAALLKVLLAGFGVDIPAGGLLLTAKTVVTCAVIGVLVSVLSAVFPARRASKVPPIAAMRDLTIEGAATGGRASRRRLIAGLVVTGLGMGLMANGLFGSAKTPLAWVAFGLALTFVGVAVLGPVLAAPVTRFLGAPLPRMKGMTGTLARNNATRNPKRTSATAAALMIGVGLVGSITVFASSGKASIDKTIDDVFKADFVLDPGTFGAGGLPPELATRLSTLPEVGTVTGIRIGMTELAGASKRVVAVDPAKFGSFFDIGVATGSFSEVSSLSSLAVSSQVANDKGLHVGDPVVLRFAQTGDQRFVVAATFAKRDLVGDYVMGLSSFEANVADQFDTQVYVKRATGVTPAAARTAIESVAKDYPSAKLQDQTEFKAAQAAQVNQLLGLIYALLGLAILIAVLGIANTLALSIFERTRELGLLRAVGMTRSQLRSAVRWESVLIALFGTGLGLVIGTGFGWAMVQALKGEGFTELRIPVGQLLVITALAAACGVLAAVLPARRASKLDVLAAITTA
jgi:putative ABC transport system permease protein